MRFPLPSLRPPLGSRGFARGQERLTPAILQKRFAERIRPIGETAVFTPLEVEGLTKWKWKTSCIDLGLLSKSRGEDASFHSSRYIGVADGVGGWINTPGVDPGDYSRGIMGCYEDLINDYERKFLHPELKGKGCPPESVFRWWYGVQEGGGHLPDPVKLMEKARRHLGKLKGSTTVSVAFLDALKGKVRYANLGDSGFLIYRPSAVGILKRTEVQQSFFNCPFQLAYEHGNHPNESEVGEIEVMHGDIFVMATDGVWDNLFDADICRILRHSSSVEQAALSIALNSHTVAHENRKKIRTPMSVREYEEHAEQAAQANKTPLPEENFSGGKPDDITVIVARVVEEGRAEAEYQAFLENVRRRRERGEQVNIQHRVNFTDSPPKDDGEPPRDLTLEEVSTLLPHSPAELELIAKEEEQMKKDGPRD